MGKRAGLLLIATVGLALSFSGCGGGSTTGIFSGAPPPPSGIQQLFFVDNAASTASVTRGTLYAVDPSNPTQPAICTDNVNRSSIRMAYSATFGAGSQIVSGVAPYALVYERGGTLFRVDGNLSARRISQGGIADNLVFLSLVFDVVEPENSWIIFRNGNNHRAVRLGTADTVPPIAVPGTEVLRDIRDGGSSVSGWLVRNSVVSSDVVNYCGVDFSGCSFVKNVTTSANVLGAFPSGDLLVRFDDQAFIFYPKRQQQQLPALSGLLYTFSGTSGWTSQESGNAIYFSDGGNIRKVESSGYGTPPTLTAVVDDATADVRITDILPTGGANLVYLRRSTTDGAATIFSVPKDGSDAPIVIEEANGVAESIVDVQVAGNRIFYNLMDAGTPVAYTVLADNTASLQQGDSYWTGGTVPDTFPVSGELPIDRVFLVRMDPAVGLDNATVISYKASTFDDPITMGTLKPDAGENITDFHISGNFGQRLLGTATIGSQSDVYYLDAVTPGSLKRVLKTPDLDETPIDPLD